MIDERSIKKGPFPLPSSKRVDEMNRPAREGCEDMVPCTTIFPTFSATRCRHDGRAMYPYKVRGYGWPQARRFVPTHFRGHAGLDRKIEEE
jgi:hypothetical protein